MLKELKDNIKNKTYTENMGVAHETTKSAMLDFFAQAGAMRGRSKAEVIDLFDAAFAENPQDALRLLFYFRDIRGGQGERELFRVITYYLADRHTNQMMQLAELIPEYGRWDDLVALINTKIGPEVCRIIRNQMAEDLQSDRPSLMAKWLPSENASSKKTIALAKDVRNALEWSSTTYRKSLSKLRERINVVERLMSAKKWGSVEYNAVPSQASIRYRKAFRANDKKRYEEYLDAVESGKEKMQAATLYPHQIVDQVLNKQQRDKAIDLLWDNLPDYVGENYEDSLVVADTSGSMLPKSICVSVGLAMYLAERNKGMFKNHFMTFSESPQIQEIRGTNVTSKINNLSDADWGYNTDIEEVFLTILRVAQQRSMPQSDMVRKIYIISDMEFDAATSQRYDETVFNTIRWKYQEAGYEMPFLVFWNVEARNKQYPETGSAPNTQLVSGMSPSLFKFLLKNNGSSFDVIKDIVNSERYAQIKVV